jgi:hypothetical protein
MRNRLWQIHALLGLAALSVAGCYSYYPNGYGGYPGPYNGYPQGAPVSPGGPTFQPPPGTSFVPPGGINAQAFNPQPSANVVQPQPWQPTSPVNPTPAAPSSENGAGNKPVPDPRDAGDFSSPQKSNSNGAEDLQSPFGLNENPAGNNAVGSGGTASEKNDPFMAPIVKPISSTRGLSDAGGTPLAERPNPYDFDREGYRWLRGVVDYDEREKSWHIIYDINPGDKYGGSMTLASDPRLNVLNTGDVVLVEGAVDPNSRDRLGKPQYRVETFSPLVPK